MIDRWRLRYWRKERVAFAYRVLRPMPNETLPAAWVTQALDVERQDFVLTNNDVYRRRRRIEALRT